MDLMDRLPLLLQHPEPAKLRKGKVGTKSAHLRIRNRTETANKLRITRQGACCLYFGFVVPVNSEELPASCLQPLPFTDKYLACDRRIGRFGVPHSTSPMAVSEEA